MCSPDSLRISLDAVAGKLSTTYELDDNFFRSAGSGEIRGGAVSAGLELVKKDATQFDIAITATGEVTVGCDLCLGDLPIPISAETTLHVSWPQDADVDNQVDVSADGVFDAGWLMYETVYLSLPMRRVHADGLCDEAMRRTLETYIR